jgi:hypothetical protein
MIHNGKSANIFFIGLIYGLFGKKANKFTTKGLKKIKAPPKGEAFITTEMKKRSIFDTLLQTSKNIPTFAT